MILKNDKKMYPTKRKKHRNPVGGVPAHNRGGGLICTGSRNQLYIIPSTIVYTLNYIHPKKYFAKNFLPKNIFFVIVKKLYYDI